MRSTVTVKRGEVDLTVVVSHGTRSPDRVVLALDEDGDRVRLTPDERTAALDLARAGVDEAGR